MYLGGWLSLLQKAIADDIPENIFVVNDTIYLRDINIFWSFISVKAVHN